MIGYRGLVKTLTGWLGKPIAGPDTDPQQFIGNLFALPNPDPILRGMGSAEQVYLSIMADAHVIGDVRSIRGNIRSFDYRVNAGDEGDSKSVAAQELCSKWLGSTAPTGSTGQGLQNDWSEVFWQMASAIMTGYRAHEVVWELVDGKFLPSQVIDRPNRRFKFDAYGAPMLVTRDNALGAVVEQPSQFVISRHMADTVNPYGVALLSSCFWPWTFKTGGWRYFVKYCERHGLPWPIGRYPIGSTDAEITGLGDALANMLEAGYVVAPVGTELELLVPTGNSGAGLPQESLIDLCNREMSKALTGQAMVAELQGVGARAASETAKDRQDSINNSDRDIAIAGMGQIFRWITLYNFGAGIAPPELELFREEHGTLERAQSYKAVVDMGGRPSRMAMLEEMGMPAAKDDADALVPAAPPIVDDASDLKAPNAAPASGAKGTKRKVALASSGGKRVDLSGVAGYEFAREAGMTDDEALQLATEAADQVIEDRMIAPVAAMLARFEAEGKTLAQFHAALEEMVGVMDEDGLREVLDRSLSYSILRGAATQAP